MIEKFSKSKVFFLIRLYQLNYVTWCILRLLFILLVYFIFLSSITWVIFFRFINVLTKIIVWLLIYKYIKILILCSSGKNPVWPRAPFSWKTIRKKVPYEGRTGQSNRAWKTRTALLETRLPKSMRIYSDKMQNFFLQCD